MKRFTFLAFLLAAATATVFFTGCSDDDDETSMGNQITINILEPADGEVMADATMVHVHVEFEATDENHNVEILIHKEGDVSDVAFEWDKHEHDQKIIFEEDIDLSSYPAGTEFHMEVEACIDHDCNEKEFADVEFSI